MRIGIDFDNTIINYDGLFKRLALEQNLVPKEIGETKNDVRDFLNGRGNNSAFTKLQGEVYGKHINLASVYEGFRNFLTRRFSYNDEVFLISHKSQFPIAGEKFDLHKSAKGFLNLNDLIGEHVFNISNIYFEPTKEKKVDRVRQLEIDLFIDDLPEILLMISTVTNSKTYLFDPNKINPRDRNYIIHNSWDSMTEALEL